MGNKDDAAREWDETPTVETEPLPPADSPEWKRLWKQLREQREGKE